jgi:hypothetical protein
MTYDVQIQKWQGKEIKGGEIDGKYGCRCRIFVFENDVINQ